MQKLVFQVYLGKKEINFDKLWFIVIYYFIVIIILKIYNFNKISYYFLNQIWSLSISIILPRFEDCDAKSGVKIGPTNEDFGYILENPPSKETQKGPLWAENAGNTGRAFQLFKFVLKC